MLPPPSARIRGVGPDLVQQWRSEQPLTQTTKPMVKRRKSVQYLHTGLLILRVGLGIMFILHGYPKLFGGPEMWARVGATAEIVGIESLPVVFGFLAGVTEFFGGIFLLFGLFFRPALIFLTVVMAVAASTHITQGDPFATVSHSIELGIVFISLLFIGPGRYSVDHKLNARDRRRR